MNFDHEDDAIQYMTEFIILIIVGTSSNELISTLHLQKEVFLIQNFDPEIKEEFFHFIKNYKGPFSRRIHETIRNPFFLADSWKYVEPANNDKLTGGFVSITNQGKKEYKELLCSIKNAEKDQQKHLFNLLAGIKIVTELYNKLNPEELLLLIYDTYPQYTEKSNIYFQLNKNRAKIASQLYEKGFIDKSKCRSLAEGKQ
ncbi:hypothetical protein [Methanobacterium formicicum]|uniref:Uncharacterized protein n=1 Tax=Methanobacterium formicicum TaxID=2162 RepID=A0A843ASL7_METFO|nr:hypothetical protein [Methanobacterium formicicum]MBF4474553.1 hypothetical protein [Methanobacterium formicicum]